MYGYALVFHIRISLDGIRDRVSVEGDVVLDQEGEAAPLVLNTILSYQSVARCCEVSRFICQFGLLHHSNMDVFCC